MRKLQRFFLASVVALGWGLTGCSDDVSDANEPGAKGTTYASLSIAFPKTAVTKAGLPGDYNPNGTWDGRDFVEKITVFLVNESLGTIDHTSFTEGEFAGIDTEGKLKPSLAIKATPGEKVKAYVVINDVNNKVTDALKGATPSGFSAAFSAAATAVASEVSAYKTEKEKDVILMTNDVEPVAVTLVKGVTEEQAKVGTVNLIKVDVQRVVSRAIVTVKTDFAKTIDVANANGVKGSTITIKEVKYGVGQSNKNFFILQPTTFATPDPVYSYKPGTVDASKFDNLGLWNMTAVSQIEDKANANVVAALAAEKPGKFVLPVTHAATDYVKGNTTYFEIQIVFTPDYVDGTGTYNAGYGVYLGKNDGKFYTTRTAAEASGQKSVYYKGDKTTGAIAKYIVWLNPDVIPGTGGTAKASQSPTVRNQVYHVHITGFKKIGVPNNPLNPGIPVDPTKPVGPTNPIDPNKADPNDPADPLNPIDPTHPLETEDTYLSVEITVLPYTVHSYEVDLGTDY
jgi:hypothetical protein